MASKKVVLRGKLYWARVYEGNHDEYSGAEFYKITLIPDDESWVKFSKTGSNLQPKPVSSTDDRKALTFRRDVNGKELIDKKTGKKVILGGGPPRVVLEDGTVLDSDTLIGNESDGEVLVEFYSSKKTKRVGHRLEAVRVTNLVKYDPFSEDDDPSPDFSETDDEQEEEKPKATKKNKDLPF
jgi:hypothetical protein